MGPNLGPFCQMGTDSRAEGCGKFGISRLKLTCLKRLPRCCDTVWYSSAVLGIIAFSVWVSRERPSSRKGSLLEGKQGVPVGYRTLKPHMGVFPKGFRSAGVAVIPPPPLSLFSSFFYFFPMTKFLWKVALPNEIHVPNTYFIPPSWG